MLKKYTAIHHLWQTFGHLVLEVVGGGGPLVATVGNGQRRGKRQNNAGNYHTGNLRELGSHVARLYVLYLTIQESNSRMFLLVQLSGPIMRGWGDRHETPKHIFLDHPEKSSVAFAENEGPAAAAAAVLLLLALLCPSCCHRSAIDY